MFYLAPSSVGGVSAGRSFFTAGGTFVDVGLSLSRETSMVFQVKAAGNAYVVLTAERLNFTEEFMYEIVLGVAGSSRAVIR